MKERYGRLTGVLDEAMGKGMENKHDSTHVYKQKGDRLECNNFRGITLLSHTLRLWKRVVESIQNCEHQ